MPVLAINLRVAPEWGVICGYKDNGADLFCRTKYDAEILDDPDFEHGEVFRPIRDNPYDYLFVDNWPFLITYFSNETIPPTDKDNLINSLRIFIDCSEQEINRGYQMGFKAYETWCSDLLDDTWYENNDNEQFARRFSVNQFCTLALYDARKSAYVYLNSSKNLIDDKTDEMNCITNLFENISEKASQIHIMLDSGEYLDGEKARNFWTKEMRSKQAELLSEMLEAEHEAMVIAKKIVE